MKAKSHNSRSGNDLKVIEFEEELSEVFEKDHAVNPTYLLEPGVVKKSNEFLATGETQRDVAFNFLAGRSTVSSIVAEVTQALWLVLQHPSTADKWMKISQGFHERWNVPHCLGAIDGKHVTIECPANSGSVDFNYKRFFSKSLLAVCDAQYSFIYVEVGHPGSESDGRIFSRSTLPKNILLGALGLPPMSHVGNEGPLPYFFVGDEAFPLKEYMKSALPKTE
ncbi:hypothetical protein HPB52_007859 [Rhipicephalus sanguineus]|uniref:DDE Tnp4 domain-containing protein n=1 Tax=Rhipicephalus sanguineus TaxID=34632 RepID=A0A9D4T343_RHISA|nr:hypothetical protein HPB52_007859 [Rhipicephalus sanguineus]